MTWFMILTCQICGATEHRAYADDEEATRHVCRANTIGEGLVTL